MNFLLDDKKRAEYADTIDFMWSVCPDMMSRKYKEANVQQAFTFDSVRKLGKTGCSILCVGSYEDTACEALVRSGVELVAIDPLIKMDLESFFKSTDKKFDVIFSTSVVEHVSDDETFVSQMCQLLEPEGFGILTCDFKETYKKGDPLPDTDVRVYTTYDITQRLRNIMLENGCDLYGSVDYSGEPDFTFSGVNYSFASLVFRKKSNDQ